MSGSRAPAGPAADNDPRDLIAAVLEDPDKVLGLSEDEVLQLQRHLNPYGYSGEKTGKSLLCSLINLREGYLERFTMTALVGFVFRMADEWTVPAEERRWTPKRLAKEAAGRDTGIATAGELLSSLEAAQAVVQQAQELEAEAAQMEEAHRTAHGNLTFTEAEMQKGVEAELEKVMASWKRVEAAKSRAAGMLYMATLATRRAGFAADDRLLATEEYARGFPEARKVIDSEDPMARYGGRLPAGQQELPQANAKQIIASFLGTLFRHNPDAHVRGAHDEVEVVRSTEERPVPGFEGLLEIDIHDPQRLPLHVALANAPPSTVAEDREPYQVCTGSQRDYNTACRLLAPENLPLAEAVRYILATPESMERFRRLLFPIGGKKAAAQVQQALAAYPPQDTFHRWRYYIEANYDLLRTATATLYHDKPDLDQALIAYDVLEGSPEEIQEKACRFRDKHLDEVRADIRLVDMGQWTWMGAFRQNRERVNFYNQHTRALERILEQHEKDQKIGKELMRQRVRKAKAQNIREAGPDAASLGDYQTTVGTNKQGADRVIRGSEMRTLEQAGGDLKRAREMEHLHELRRGIDDLRQTAERRELTTLELRNLEELEKGVVRAEEMLEVPDNAIQVDAWVHDTKTGEFKRNVIYTKAEDPEPRSEADLYPPSVRQGGRTELAPFARDYLNASAGAASGSAAGPSPQ